MIMNVSKSSKAAERKESRLRILRENIEKERQAILCLEAQLECARKGKKNLLSGKKRKQSDNVVDFIDLLGDHSMDIVSASMKELLEQSEEAADPIDCYRLVPLMSGIFFTHVSPPTLTSENNAKNRLYELEGKVLPEIGSLHFIISHVASACSTNAADDKSASKSQTSAEGFKIESLNVKVERPSTSLIKDLQRCIVHHHRTPCHEPSGLFATEELDDLASLAETTRNVPKLFRDMVTYAEFDAHRTSTLLELHATHGHSGRFSILSPCKVRIMLLSADAMEKNERVRDDTKRVHIGSIDIVWKWKFSLLSSCGKDHLVIESIQVAPTSLDPGATHDTLNELKERGLDDIISLLGDCSKALQLLLNATGVGPS